MHKISILCLLGVFSLSVVLAANSCTYISATASPCCDQDTLTVKASGDYCGAEDDCNNQRTCDGSTATCPTNPKTNAAGTKCSRASNRCHNDGVCDAGGNCLPQTQKPTDSVCIPADDSNCQKVRKCLANGNCGAAQPAGPTVTCHTSTGPCDNTVMCPATTASNPYACTRSGTGRKVCRNEDLATCTGRAYCPVAHTPYQAADSVCPDVYIAEDTSCGDHPCVALKCTGTRYGCDTEDPRYPQNAGVDCTASASCPTGQTAECDGSGNCNACHPPSPGGTNDPLIAGFHHQRFWLEGESGKFYNMFSQPEMTLNAKIVNARAATEKLQTVMGEIAFITKNNVVHITPLAGRNGSISVNGKNVQLSAQANVYDLDDCVQMAWSPKSMLFSSASFEIVIAFMAPNARDNLNVDYLNVKIPHVSGDVTKMSGIIGQTAHETKHIEKNWNQFAVSDLMAHDSHLNTFEGADLACDIAEASKRSVGKFETANKKEVNDMSLFANVNA